MSLVLGMVLVASALLARSAIAGQIDVNTNLDQFNTGPECSLREAISSAQTNIGVGGCSPGAGTDTIVLPTGAYDLTLAGTGDDSNLTGDLDVNGTDALTIRSADGAKVSIDGLGNDRVLQHVGNGPLEIRGITVTGGRITLVNDGGGILNGFNSLTLDRVTLSGNSAGNDGGGLANYAQATLTNTTISGNSGNGQGGGYYGPGGSTATFNNVTIAGNTADKDVDGNGDGGGISAMGSISSYNSIIALNTDDSGLIPAQVNDCVTGPNFFPRHTLIGDFVPAECLIGFDPGTNIVNVNPKLGLLADNGGPLQTRALLVGSPAIDAGGSAAPDQCASTDERGISRPQGSACDVGAFELAPTPPTPVLKVSPKPKIKKTRRGKVAIFKVKVKNTGTAAAAKARVCLKVKSPLRAKGRKCASLGTIAVGKTKTTKLKVKVASGAARKSYKVSFRATANGARAKTAKAKLKVR